MKRSRSTLSEVIQTINVDDQPPVEEKASKRPRTNSWLSSSSSSSPNHFDDDKLDWEAIIAKKFDKIQRKQKRKERRAEKRLTFPVWFFEHALSSVEKGEAVPVRYTGRLSSTKIKHLVRLCPFEKPALSGVKVPLCEGAATRAITSDLLEVSLKTFAFDPSREKLCFYQMEPSS